MFPDLRSAPWPRRHPLWRTLAVLTAVAMVCTLLPSGVPKASAAPTGAGPGVGSLALGLSPLSGLVDERTGLVTFTLPVGSLIGPGGSGLDLRIAYAQQQATNNRWGLGGGSGFNLPYVDTTAGRLVLDDGRSFAIDAQGSARSGLQDYRLTDSVFRRQSGTTPDGRAYAYVYSQYPDAGGNAARRDWFSAGGDLLTRSDRFGNLTTFGFDAAQRLTSVTGGYGQKLTLSYSGSSTVTLTWPQRADGVTPKSVLALTSGRITSVTDANSDTTSIAWGSFGPQVLPTSVAAPSGVRTSISYQSYPPGIWAVSSVTPVSAGSGAALAPPTSVQLDPLGNRHNYTGCPTHCANGGDQLVTSNDKTYTYTTVVAQGPTEIWRTYNNLHLLKRQETRARLRGALRTISSITNGYPGEVNGNAPDYAVAPATYQLPTTVTASAIDPSNASRTASVTTTSTYDDAGRLLTRRAPDQTLSRTYGAYGQVTLESTTDRTTGTTRQVTTTLDPATGNRTPRTTTVTVTPGTAIPAANDSAPKKVKNSRKAKKPKKPCRPNRCNVGATATTLASTIWSYASDGELKSKRTTSGDGRQSHLTTYTTALSGTQLTRTVVGPGPSATTVTDVTSGLTLSTRDGAGATTSYRYDAGGRRTEQRLPDGTRTTTAYTLAGPTGSGSNSVVTTRSADGYAVRTVTNPLGRTLSQADNLSHVGGPHLLPAGSWRTLRNATYDPATGLVKTTSDAASGVTTYGYNEIGRTSTITAPNGVVRTFSYDDVANSTTTGVRPAGASAAAMATTRAVDQAGNITSSSTSYADGTPTVGITRSYNGFDQPIATTEVGAAIATRFDPTGARNQDVVSASDPARGGKVGGNPDVVTATYANDSFGRRTFKTLSAPGAETIKSPTVAYDGAGRVSTRTDQAGGTTTTSYNDAGLPETVTYPDGRVRHMRYDPLGREVESWGTTSSEPGVKSADVVSDYDTATGKVSAVYDPADPSGTRIGYAYNPDGTVRLISYPDGQTISYTYDDAGRRSTMTDTAGVTTTYHYNREGTLHDVSWTSAKGPAGSVTYGYDALGRLSTVTRSNGVVSTYGYDNAGRVTSESHATPGSAALASRRYTYDPVGNLRTDVATDAGVSTATEYDYDSNNRLTSSEVTAGSQPGAGRLIRRSAYTLDLTGNVTSRSDTSLVDGKPSTTTTAYSINPLGQPTSVTVNGKAKSQTYDPAGSLTAAVDGTSYNYDAARRLISATTPEGKTTRYTYWPNGARRSKTLPDGTTLTFYYDGSGHLINERDARGTSAVYLAGATREARALVGANSPDGTSFYLASRRGDTIALTDAGGSPTARYSYSDYGTIVSGPAGTTGIASNPFTYAGGYTDSETGNAYLLTRYYDPDSMRFLTRDITTLLSQYGYGAGNPVTYIDPTGMAPSVWTWISIAAGSLALAASIAAVAICPPVGLLAISLTAAGLLASATTMAIESTLAADSIHPFLSETARHNLEITATVVGVVGLLIGLGSLTSGLSAVEGAGELTGVAGASEGAAGAGADAAVGLEGAADSVLAAESAPAASEAADSLSAAQERPGASWTGELEELERQTAWVQPGEDNEWALDADIIEDYDPNGSTGRAPLGSTSSPRLFSPGDLPSLLAQSSARNDQLVRGAALALHSVEHSRHLIALSLEGGAWTTDLTNFFGARIRESGEQFEHGADPTETRPEQSQVLLSE